MMSNYVIKPAETAEERDGRGYVHYQSWQETYAGLVDLGYLAGMTPEKCVSIAHQFPDNVLVAKAGEQVVGFAAYGGYRDDTLGDCGEIYAIYVLGAHQGKQVGLALMNAAVQRLSEYEKIALWVLRGNERAIRFYETYGFRFDGTEEEIVLDTPRTELRMIYQKLSKGEISFSYLDKGAFSSMAPVLFAILHENMSKIAPTGNRYEEDERCWTHAFGGAFTGRETRRIVLIFDGGTVVGFFCYAVMDGTFHMEEIQLSPDYWGKYGIFRALYRFVLAELPPTLDSVEAYAHRNNEKSQGILCKLGLKNVGMNKNGSCCHFVGRYSEFLRWFHGWDR